VIAGLDPSGTARYQGMDTATRAKTASRFLANADADVALRRAPHPNGQSKRRLDSNGAHVIADFTRKRIGVDVGVRRPVDTPDDWDNCGSNPWARRQRAIVVLEQSEGRPCALAGGDVMESK